MKLINEKIVEERIKSEYKTDKQLTIEYVKDMLYRLIDFQQYEFDKVELNDDTSIFDGGIRTACSEKNKVKEFINQKLNNEITEVVIWGKYNDKGICIIFEINEDIIRTSSREEIDIKSLLEMIENKILY